MKKYLFFLLVMLLAFPAMMVAAQDDVIVQRLEAYGNNLPQGYGITAPQDVMALLVEQDVVLIDVRQPEEYEGGHIEGSFNVPLREVGNNLNLLPDKDATIVVICQVGARATLASTALQILGYENVLILRGGINGWTAEELPLVTEPFVPEAGEAPELDPIIFEAVNTYLTGIPQGFGMVSATNLAAELVENPPFLIDVRSADEWNTGYIDGAEHIWINEFISRRAELPTDKDTTIVVYCGSAYRGAMAAVMMNLLGYTDVRNLSGGLNAWNAAELPLVGVPEQVVEEADFALDAYLANSLAALPATFNAVRPADLAEELNAGTEILLVDVRSETEFAEGFIEGAINIPISQLTQNLDLLPELDQKIVLYCGSGHRSAIGLTALAALGYTDVRSMLSGTNGWTAAELPLSQTPVDYVGGTAPAFDPNVFAPIDSYISTIPQGYYTVRAADLGAELIENPPFLLDVRTDSEWANGYIEGAVHLPLAGFFAGLDQLPTDTEAPIVVYDNPTHRSSMAMTFLRLLGYENVRVLGGGTGAWTNAGLPLVTD